MIADIRPSSYFRCTGLTALDLVITLAIITLLLVTGVPAVHQLLMHQRLKAAVVQLRSDLTLARNEAIHRAARIVSCPKTTAGSCADTGSWQHGWLVFQDLNDDREWQPAEPLLRSGSAIEGLRILGSDHRIRLRFFPNGTAPGSNVSIHFCSLRGANSARQLILSASGRIRLKPAGEADSAVCEA